MKQVILIALRCFVLALISFSSVGLALASPWDKDYFPDVSLVTQDGETVSFFDDLLKDKIVAVNFIYTSCPDTCPLETAQLVKVQNILGERLGKDVFFYSISIDPDTDTPAVLKEYKERFKANWTFLTGEERDIIEIRRKLGLYIEEIQADESNNHNVNMIIGNQKTGRWMKRSPFENPYVLADQLGNWLSGWKTPVKKRDYADAPALRNIPTGEQLFRTRCQTCHTVTGQELAGALGPDLLGVTEIRDPEWLLNWLRAPDQMLAEKDPLALELLKQYNNLAMPNMRLNKQEALDLLAYLESETTRLKGRAYGKPGAGTSSTVVSGGKRDQAEDVVAIMNAWVREALPKSPRYAGYMTMINVGPEAVELERVETDAFKKVEVHEMVMKNGMMSMRELTDLKIRSNGHLKLAPGGKHLMLIGPQRDLVAGEKVEITLLFKSGRRQHLTLNVEDR